MNIRLHPSPAITQHRERDSQRLRVATVAVTGFSAINAVAGGIGLLVNGLGVPREQLDGTPFSSFTIPGLLLAVVVGGSMLTAAISVWQRVPWAGSVAMVAGAVMLGWIAIESVMINDGRVLQVVVAMLSLLAIALGSALQRQARAH